MRFDYYGTRVEVLPPALIEECLKLGHELRPCDGLAKAYRYRQGFQVHHHQKGVVATVLWREWRSPVRLGVERFHRCLR